MNYLWDTNIAIYYLQKQFTASAEEFIDDILKTNPPALSVISEIELMSWKTAEEKDLIVLKNFLNDASIVELDRDIKNGAAELRKSVRLKLPDAIIAATSLSIEAILLPRNTQDFEKCSTLRIINPFKL